MKITEVEVRLGSTVNLGNYESLRIDLSARAVFDEDDELMFDVVVALRDGVRKQLDTLVKEEISHLRR